MKGKANNTEKTDQPAQTKPDRPDRQTRPEQNRTDQYRPELWFLKASLGNKSICERSPPSYDKWSPMKESWHTPSSRNNKELDKEHVLQNNLFSSISFKAAVRTLIWIWFSSLSPFGSFLAQIRYGAVKLLFTLRKTPSEFWSDRGVHTPLQVPPVVLLCQARYFRNAEGLPGNGIILLFNCSLHRSTLSLKVISEGTARL